MQLIEALDNGVLVTDRDWRILKVNRRFEEITGFYEDELLGEEVLKIAKELVKDKDIEKVINKLKEETCKSGLKEYADIIIESKEGDEKCINLKISFTGDEGSFNMVILNDVANSKNIEEEIGDKRVLTETFLSNLPGMTLLSNLPGMAYRCLNNKKYTMKFVSDGCKELTGYEPEDIIEDNIQAYGDLIIQEDRDKVWGEIQSALHNDDPFKITYRIETLEGEIKWVWEQGRKVHIENEGRTYLEGFITDITEKKEAKDELKEREKKIKILHDKAMEFERCQSEEEICELVVAVSEDILDFYVGSIDFIGDGEFEVKATIEGIAGRTIKENRSFLIEDLEKEEIALPRRGSYKSAISIPFGMFGVFQALSEEKDYFNEKDLELAEILVNHAAEAISSLRYEEQLKKSKIRFETLISKAQEGIYIGNPDGVINYVNEKFADILGHDVGELIGKRYRELFHPESRKELEDDEAYDKEAVESDEPEEIKVVKKDGSIIYLLNSISVIESIEGKKEIFGLVHDITELKKRQESINHLNSLLKSIRNVNQLITQEDDVIELMEKSLELLIEARGYSRASIFIIDDEQVSEIVGNISRDEIGFKEEELVEIIEPQVIKKMKVDSDYTQAIAPLIDNELEGILAIEKKGETAEEELNLLLEIAGDLAMAKNKINAEERLKNSLEEKEILLDEIHHRVKNNLQVISSMLKLQETEKKDKDPLSILRETENRIQSMALIHEMLHRSDDIARVDLGSYIKELVRIIYQTYNVDYGDVELKMDVDDIKLSIDQANPCVQVINEIVSNALKHAFPLDYNGNKTLSISSSLIEGQEVEIVISDNGVGVPEKIDLENSETFGFNLIKMLSEDQLDGDVELERDGGTTFKIRFGKEEDNIDD